MTKENLVKNDLQNLLCVLEDVVNRFYDLDVMDDDDILQALGLMFAHRSLYRYMEKYYHGKDN